MTMPMRLVSQVSTRSRCCRHNGAERGRERRRATATTAASGVGTDDMAAALDALGSLGRTLTDGSGPGVGCLMQRRNVGSCV